MPRIVKGLLFLFVLGFQVCFSNSAQAGVDPEGSLDSFYVDCGGFVGDTLVMKLRFRSDNTGLNKVAGFSLPVLITVSNNALISLDTTVARTYDGSMVSGFALKVTGTDPTGGADPTQSPVHFGLGAISFSGGVTGDSLYANIRLRLNAVNTVITIDTLSGQGALNPNLVTELTDEYLPGWKPVPESCVVLDVKDTKQGDVTARPTSYSLGQNYPNPFNASTVIQFALPKTSDVKLEIFNVLGQKVVTLVDEELQTGYKQVVWDGKDQRGNSVATGIYFYRIRAEDVFSDMKKMLYIK